MKMERIDITKLKIHPDNRRYFRDIRETSPAFWEDFVGNIKELGLLEPLIVNEKTLEIISGNQRYMACLEARFKKVPCVFIAPEDKDEEIAQMLSSNIYRRQLDAIQLIDLVKILRERIKARKPGPKNGDEVPDLSGEELPPSEQVQKTLRKGQEFISGADLFNNLPPEQQKKIRDWFYEQEKRPTDKALIEKIKKERDESIKKLEKQIDELKTEAKEKDLDHEENITKLKGDLETLENKIVAFSPKVIMERLTKKLDKIRSDSEKLATETSKFVRDFRKEFPDGALTGIDPAIIRGKIEQLSKEMQNLYECFGTPIKLIEGEAK